MGWVQDLKIYEVLEHPESKFWGQTQTSLYISGENDRYSKC